MNTRENRNEDFSVHLLDADIFQKQQNNSTDLDKAKLLDSNQALLKEIATSILRARKGQVGFFSSSTDTDTTLFDNNDLSLIYDSLNQRMHDFPQKEMPECLKEKDLYFDAVHTVDVAKIATMYTKMQRIVAENPDKKDIHITIWSTNSFILRSEELFFSQNLTLVPRPVTLHFVEHRSEDSFVSWDSPLVKNIEGRGQPNEFYEATQKAIARELTLKKEELVEAKRSEHLTQESMNTWSKIILPLQGKALVFSGQLKSGTFQGNSEKDPDYDDMLSIHSLKEQKKMDSFKALLDEHKNKKNDRAVLVTVMLEKITTATTQKEIRGMITMLSSEDYRSLLHDRRGQGWSFINRTWQGNPISTTFSDLIKIAKWKILDLEARHTPEYQNGRQVANPSLPFLQTSRHWAKWRDTQSSFFYKKLYQPRKKGSVHQDVLKGLELSCQAVKKRCRIV